MKKHILAFLLTLVMALGVCGVTAAAEPGLVGFVNVQQVFRSHPDFNTSRSALELEQQNAQKEFASKADSLDDKGKQELGEKLSERVAKREDALMGPIRKAISKAIETVAKRNGINSVVDSAAMVYGGKDLTGEVFAEVSK